MVGCDAAWKHVRSLACDGAVDVCFGGIGDECCPEGEELTKLERVGFGCEVKLDLSKAQISVRKLIPLPLRGRKTHRYASVIILNEHVMPTGSFGLFLTAAVDGIEIDDPSKESDSFGTGDQLVDASLFVLASRIPFPC